MDPPPPRHKIIIIDGRYILFKERVAHDLDTGEAIADWISKNLDTSNSSMILSKFQAAENLVFVVFPTKSKSKLEFYTKLSLQLEKKIGAKGVYARALDKEQGELWQALLSSFLPGKVQLVDLVVVSHNLSMPAFQMLRGWMKQTGVSVYKILYSDFRLDPAKKRMYEELAYHGSLVDYHIVHLLQVESGVGFVKYCEKQTQSDSINVGYVFDPKKVIQFVENRVLMAEYPFRFIPLDFRVEYNDIPYEKYPIRILLHKINNLVRQSDPQPKNESMDICS